VVNSYTVKKGDLWTGPTVTVNHSDPAFDFTGCEIKSQLRLTPSAGEVIYPLVIAPDFSTLGEVSFQMGAPGTATATFPPQNLVGDVVISRDSPLFGMFSALLEPAAADVTL